MFGFSPLMKNLSGYLCIHIGACAFVNTYAVFLRLYSDTEIALIKQHICFQHGTFTSLY